MRPSVALSILAITVADRFYQEGTNIVRERIKAPFDEQPAPVPKRDAPLVQVIDQCEYSEFYLDLLKEVNKIRYGVDDTFSICMNIKLMWAAKTQSDHQALVEEPTHAGPRMLKLGSVEERIDASKFDQNSGLVSAEEIIYYWPKFPLEAYGKARRKILKAALQDILQDKTAAAIIRHPAYRFMGGALTRKSDGQAFLTIVLGDSLMEPCHVCYKLADGSLARQYQSKKKE